MELYSLTLGEAIEGLRRRRFSVLDYVQALTARTRACVHYNAYVALDEDALFAAAKAADAASAAADPSRCLAGIPIAIKDNIDTVTFPTTACTGALAGRTPSRSASVVERLLAAGALIAGKTNMHELAFGVTNNNFVTGPARNPYDSDRIAGGSSGGSAVAVAGRMVPASLGTDTGSSVRLPAALCGVIGLRPTHGRYPGDGIIPVASSRDTVGPMARSVEDIALLDAILCAEPPQELLSDRQVSNLRLGIAPQFWAELDHNLDTVMDATLERFTAAGVTLVEVDMSAIMNASRLAGPAITRYEFVRDLQTYLESHSYGLGVAQIAECIGSADVAAIVRPLLADNRPTYESYAQGLVLREKMRTLYSTLFSESDLDGLIHPTSILPAAPIGDDAVVQLNGAQVPTFEAYNRNTAPASIAGIPGISIPVGLTAHGLPVGLEIDAKRGSDRLLLALARDLARLLPQMPPPA